MNTQVYRGFHYDRSIFVPLILPSGYATGAFITFADVPQLRGAHVQGIEAFTDAQLTKTPLQASVFEDAAKKEMMMTFVEDADNRFENVPYYTLIASSNGGLIRTFKDLKININKSGVFIGGTTATAGKSLALVFYYSNLPLHAHTKKAGHK
jgi:hypothetical protein